MKKIQSLAQVVSRIPARATIACGGFQLNRPPMALVRELIRQGNRRLDVVLLPNALPLDWLAAARMVDFADVTFSGFQYEFGSVTPPNWQRACERAELRWRERDALYLVQRLRAAAMGLPVLPLPRGVLEAGDDDVRLMRDPFSDGAVMVVVKALEPDYALVHAQAADEKGNLWVDDPVTDVLLAKASRRVLATAERIESKLSRTNIPNFLVEAVAEAPSGAWPAACAGCYRHDAEAISRYVRASREGRFEDFLAEYDAALGRRALEVVA